MITGLLAEASRYRQIHPAFADAFEFVNSGVLAELPEGSHTRQSFTAVVVVADGKGRDGARLEYHCRDIDIHLTIDGVDLIGWRPRSRCTADGAGFDDSRDIGFVQDRPDLWIPVPTGSFAVFFPEDGHAPLAGTGPIRKVVVKITDLVGR